MLPSPVPSPEIGQPRWNPLVVSLVAFICTSFLVISYFRVVKQLCSAINGSTFARNQDRRHLLNDQNPEDSPIQFDSHGLELSTINSLPITKFKKKEQEQEPNTSATDCAVCLGEFEEGEMLKHLPNCGHGFHSCCIDTWLESHSNCPLCRSNIVCDDQLSIPFEFSVSMYTLLETLRREDFFHERAEQYHVLRSTVLQNNSLGHEATTSSLID
ncbi:hypothetical protein Dsin_020234 [Dipteronia sinensis]|uniref:RING-type E3 ubiquitin transferase n=1 Tax=Dipteronia sinensis TaxID=43782 RepID=A0AAE0E3J9_9ROSI|nr:hypothetical protein Dsin_020234 [Dipteronia sinensis]